MTYIRKPNSGSLFKNNRKIEPSHADYNGTVNIEGVEMYVNAWLNRSEKGDYFSLSFKPKQLSSNTEQPAYVPSQLLDDEEIPF